MTVHPPKLLAPKAAPNALDVLQHEMMQEKAATLARMTRALEHALAALAAFDAQRAASDADSTRCGPQVGCELRVRSGRHLRCGPHPRRPVRRRRAPRGA